MSNVNTILTGVRGESCANDGDHAQDQQGEAGAGQGRASAAQLGDADPEAAGRE